MHKYRKAGIVAGSIALFTGLVGSIIFLAGTKRITVAMAMLMLVALLGMYVGFGFLIAVYRFVAKLK